MRHIPPPPPAVGKRKKKRGLSPRFFVWPGALVVGVGLGVAAYLFVPQVDVYFDYWLALALS
jgi:hypothetical protein